MEKLNSSILRGLPISGNKLYKQLIFSVSIHMICKLLEFMADFGHIKAVSCF